MNHVTKKAIVAGGCFWGEDMLGAYTQDLASRFLNTWKKLATRCTDLVETTMLH